MSKPDPARGWDFAMKLLSEEQIDRVANMSDAELDAEMRRLGLNPADHPDVEELLEKLPRAPAPVVPLAPRRRRWPVLLAAAAALAAAVPLALQMKDWLAGGGGPIAQIDAGRPVPSASQALVRAEALRDDAERACAEALWGTCEQKLDDAQALDPGGEREPRVVRMRVDLAEAQIRRQAPSAGSSERFLDSKPPLRPRK